MLFRNTHGLHNTTVTVHKILSLCSKMFSCYVWDNDKCASSLVQHRAVKSNSYTANLLHNEIHTLEGSNRIHLGHMDLYCAKNNMKTQTNRGLARQHSNTSGLLNNTDPLNMQQAGWLNVIQAQGLWCHCEGDTVEVEFWWKTAPQAAQSSPVSLRNTVWKLCWWFSSYCLFRYTHTHRP